MNMENFKKYLVNVQKSFTGVFVTIYVLCALCIGVGVIKRRLCEDQDLMCR